MGFFLFLILIIFLFWVIPPIFRFWRAMRHARKGDFSFFFDVFSNPGSQRSASAYDANGRRKEGWSRPRPKKKKFAKTEGEYVKYHDLPANPGNSRAGSNGSNPAGSPGSNPAANPGSSSSEFAEYSESQVIDVQWEDI